MSDPAAPNHPVVRGRADRSYTGSGGQGDPQGCEIGGNAVTKNMLE